MDEISFDCSFGKCVSNHITRVLPCDSMADFVIQQLTQVLDMTQEAFLDWHFNHGGCDCSDNGHRIDNKNKITGMTTILT